MRNFLNRLLVCIMMDGVGLDTALFCLIGPDVADVTVVSGV
jgi:hypothetical protein